MQHIDPFSTEIVNVVAMGDIKRPLDLGHISRIFRKVAYEPKRFPGLIFKKNKSSISIMAFNSGKIICSGAKSVRQAKMAITNFVRRLNTNGLDSQDKLNVETQNIVAHSDFKIFVDLENLARLLKRSVYEPDQFPGLIHMNIDPKVTFLIFTNGKVVCTGARTEDDVYRSLNSLYKKLKTDYVT